MSVRDFDMVVSGVVAYTDGGKGSFSAFLDADDSVVTQVDSDVHYDNVQDDRSGIISSTTGKLGRMAFSKVPGTPRDVADATLFIRGVVALDDNTTKSFAAVWEVGATPKARIIDGSDEAYSLLVDDKLSVVQALWDALKSGVITVS